MARGHGVEPAAAPRPAGGRAELAAHAVEHVGDLRVLGRQRPFAHARGVGLHHAHHAVHAMRRDARAGAGAAGRGVRGGHERIGAVINVQEGALRALEQDVIAAAQRLVQQNDRVGDKRLQVIARRAVVRMDLLERQRLGAEGFEHLVVLLDPGFELALEARRVDQVDHAQARPRRLVAVGRADAALGRANLVLALEGLALGIQLAMIGKDQVRRLAEEEVACQCGRRACAAPRFPATRLTGSTTTPLPMTQTLFLRRMPDGTRCRTYFWP